MYLNKVHLIGNLTRDPEKKALPSGMSVTSFSIAVNEVYYDKDKKKQERVEYLNIVAFGKIADNVAQYMKKGSQVYVDGKIQTRSWEKDGEKKYRTEIIANTVQFGSSKKSASDDHTEDAPGDDAPDHTDEDINPEDIPF